MCLLSISELNDCEVFLLFQVSKKKIYFKSHPAAPYPDLHEEFLAQDVQ